MATKENLDMKKVKEALVELLYHYKISDKEGNMGVIGNSGKFYHIYKIKEMKTKIKVVNVDYGFTMLEVKNLEDVKLLKKAMFFFCQNYYKILE